jgi:5-methylcytosine-specific restriction endonuclease McrA
MKKKTSNHPWYFYYVRAAISKIWRWSPARRAALAAASVGTGKRCAICKEVIEPGTKVNKRKKKRKFSGVEVDHIVPVVDPATGQISWDDYITRKLNVTPADLQVLCVSCHKEKSASENQDRRKAA